MIGATATGDGAAGLVPPPPKGTKNRYLGADGTWSPPDGGNADTLDGFHASQTRNAANTCVVRDANGYVQLGYIDSDSPDNEDPAISQVVVTNGSDGYHRKSSLQHLKDSMGIGGFIGNVMSAGISTKNTVSGYMEILEFTARPYNAYDIGVVLKTRGGGVRKVSVCFDETSGADPGVKRFAATPVFGYLGTSFAAPLDVYLAKTATSRWGVFVRTYQWGDIDYILFLGGAIGAENVSIAVSSLPTGYITPTEVAYIP